MELRSHTRQKKEIELKELQLALEGLGIYEEGMDLYEMRQLWEALQQSVGETETSFLNCNIERAMMDGELDSLGQPEVIFNSTMHNNVSNEGVSEYAGNVGPINFYRRTLASPFSSPETPTTQLVHAEVHHEMDWNPIKENSLADSDAPSGTTSNEESPMRSTHDRVSQTKEITRISNSVLDSGISSSELCSSILVSTTGSSSFGSSNSNATPEEITSWYDRIQASSSSVVVSERNLDSHDTSESSL